MPTSLDPLCLARYGTHGSPQDAGPKQDKVLPGGIEREQFDPIFILFFEAPMKDRFFCKHDRQCHVVTTGKSK